MLNELLAELRMHHCDAKEDDTQEVCEECAYDVIIADKSVPSGIASVCVCGLMHRAADAIEELSLEYESVAKSLTESVELVRKLQSPRWIPVTERLPEEKINPHTHDFEPIICSTNFGDVRVYKYGTPIGWNEPHFWNGAGIMDWYVTHWMNLPKPPKEDK